MTCLMRPITTALRRRFPTHACAVPLATAAFAVLCAMLLPSPASAARAWVVSPDGTGDAPTIRAAMDSAQAGDAVILEGGTYYEHDIELKSGVLLTSVTGQPDCTVIDAERDGRVLRGRDLETGTRVTGITLKNGRAVGVEDGYGNLLCYGNGVYLWKSSLSISNCIFLDNYIQFSTGPEISNGGAIYAEACVLTLTDCEFSGNTAHWGGGVWCLESSVSMSGCRFHDNMAWTAGGLYIGASTLQMTGCLFTRNQSLGPGGALWVDGTLETCTIDNCTFSANDSEWGIAAGIWWACDECMLTVLRTIIAFSTHGNAVTCNGPGNILFECCDIYGNAGGDWVGGLEGQAGINGNFSLDPRFCAEESDNLALMQCSPCAPGNHPDGANCRQIGALPVACPGTAVEPTTWGHIKSLFR